MNKKVLTISALCIGVFSMIFGCLRGEVQMVLQKSINICLECIGIG